MQLFLGLAVLLGLSGCATEFKRGETYYEGGLYDQAVAVFEGILVQDPKDADAAVALRKSREKLIDKRLIDVRMARLAGSGQQALDLLLSVSTREAEWKQAPTGNVAFTQDEEARFAMLFAEVRVKQDLAEGVPLRADRFLRRYAPALAPVPGGAYAALRTTVLGAGKRSCQGLIQAAAGKRWNQVPAYALFAGRYCAYFQEMAPALTGDGLRYLGGLYRSFEPEIRVGGLPAGAQPILAAALREAFLRTAFFDSQGGQRLAPVMGGHFTQEDTRQQVPLAHTYIEWVPYTDYAEVQKSKDISYTELENGKEVTRHRTESYSETVPVTRKREVVRTYAFTGWRVARRLEAAYTGSVTVAGTPVQLAISDATRTEGEEHTEDQPAIGLRPRHPELTPPEPWAQGLATRLAARLEARLSDLWVETRCRWDGDGDALDEAQAVHECLRQPRPSYPTFAETWFQKGTGLSIAEAQETLRLGGR